MTNPTKHRLMASHINENPGTIARKPPVTASFNDNETYNRLKQKFKEITELNVAMSRDYSHAKKTIRTLTFERNLLLDNIGRLESSSNLTDDSDSDNYSDLSDTFDDDAKSFFSRKKGHTSHATVHYFAPVTHDRPTLTTTSSSTKILAAKPTTSTTSTATITTAALSSPQRQVTNHATQATSDTTDMSLHMSPHQPPPHKRSKLTPQSVKTRRVQPIERDDQGRPKLPQQIGVLTVHHLGTIVVDRPNYHNERYIFPIGYAVSRTYPSMVDPHSNTVITSSIIDGGDCPRFQVVAADMPHESIVANSATGAWTVVVRRSNEIRQREHSNSASGPDYYGFKHPTIAKLIQDLPGAKQLKHYVWQTFEEMEPRAAKGVMAAAEKKRGNLEQMGSANRKVPSFLKTPGNRHSTLIYQEQGDELVVEDDEVDELAASDKEEDA